MTWESNKPAPTRPQRDRLHRLIALPKYYGALLAALARARADSRLLQFSSYGLARATEPSAGHIPTYRAFAMGQFDRATTLLGCGAVGWIIFSRGVLRLVNWWISRRQLSMDRRNVGLKRFDDLNNPQSEGVKS